MAAFVRPPETIRATASRLEDLVRPPKLMVLPLQLRYPDPLIGPGPSSVSARATHVRSTSGWMPSCSVIRLQAPARVAGALRALTGRNHMVP